MLKNRVRLCWKGSIAPFAAAAVVVLGSAQGHGAVDELARVEERLMEGMRASDGEVIRKARDELRWLAENEAGAARASRGAGLAGLLVILSGNGGEDSTKILEESVGYLDRAEELDEADVELYMTRLLCQAWRMQADPACSTAVQPAVLADLQRAQELDPEDPALRFVMAMNSMMGPDGTVRRSALDDFEQALAGFAARRGEDGPASWWELYTFAMTARGWLMLGHEGEEQARELCSRALELAPDFVLIERSILPQLEPLELTPVEGVRALSWRELASDAEADATKGVDGRTFSYAVDAEAQLVWFRFDYFDMGSPDSIGVNVVLDLDGEPTNGIPWWGSTKDFRFDRVVTVWIRRGSEGRYRGNVGISDASHVRAMIMNHEATNALAICVDEEDGAVAIGVPRARITGAAPLRVVGAVGSAMSWSDDVSTDGPVELELGEIVDGD